jgi:hypothetical protein
MWHDQPREPKESQHGATCRPDGRRGGDAAGSQCAAGRTGTALTTWKTPCQNARECSFQVNAALNAAGVDITISLDEIKPMPSR